MGSYQKRFPIFFEGTPFQLKPSMDILEPTTRKITGGNRCLVFPLFGCKIRLYDAFFPDKSLQWLSVAIFTFQFVLFNQSGLVFLHDFSTLLSDRGSLVYIFLRFDTTFLWIVRTILVARSFDCYCHCINVGLGGSVAYCEILTMRFFGYAAGLAWSLLLAW